MRWEVWHKCGNSQRGWFIWETYTCKIQALELLRDLAEPDLRTNPPCQSELRRSLDVAD